MVLERTQKIWETFEKCGCMSKGRGIDGGTGRPVGLVSMFTFWVVQIRIKEHL